MFRFIICAIAENKPKQQKLKTAKANKAKTQPVFSHKQASSCIVEPSNSRNKIP